MFIRNENLSRVNGADDGMTAKASVDERGVIPHPMLPYGSDYVLYAYTGGFITTATYRIGGAAGTIVRTLTYTNNGTDYTSITES
jgi:hypothetical protein